MSAGGLLKLDRLVLNPDQGVFGDNGDLVPVAGLTEGVFFHYFKSKDELGLPRPIIGWR